VRAIRATNGVVLSIPDEEILAAKRTIDGSGVGCEPASAASVAGVKRLVGDGTIRKGETVVAVLTGHVLKDPEILLKGENQPVEVDGTIEAIAAAVG
jgi:threonine synthase